MFLYRLNLNSKNFPSFKLYFKEYFPYKKINSIVKSNIMYALYIFSVISCLRLKKIVTSRFVILLHITRCDKRPTSLPVLIEGRHVLRIDATVAKNLALLLSDLTTRNQTIIFWNWCEDARQTLISYDSSFETYCKSSGSIARIFAGKFSNKIFALFSY